MEIVILDDKLRVVIFVEGDHVRTKVTRLSHSLSVTCAGRRYLNTSVVWFGSERFQSPCTWLDLGWVRHKWLTTKVSKQRGKDTLAAPLGHLTVSVALQLLTDRLRKHETQSMLLRFESLAYCRCVRVSPSSSSYSEGEAPDRILPTALTGRSRSAPAGSLTLTGVFFLEPNGNRTPLNAAATVDKTPFPLGWTSLGAL